MESYCKTALMGRTSLFLEAPYPETTQRFLSRLMVSKIHPYCIPTNSTVDIEVPRNIYSHVTSVSEFVQLTHRPLSESSWNKLHDNSLWQETITTLWRWGLPYRAFIELWIRLISGYIAPFAVLCLVIMYGRQYFMIQQNGKHRASKNLSVQHALKNVALASSLILLTDSQYVQEFGSAYGVAMMTIAVMMSSRSQSRRRIAFALFVSYELYRESWSNTFIGSTSNDTICSVSPGLYFDSSNSFVNTMIKYWPEEKRTYNPTPWILTGDARTGLPFFFNTAPDIDWHRVYLTNRGEDHEVLALDIAFPAAGYNANRPVYIVLTGANGGSDDAIIRDLAYRRNQQGSTVVVMISRGLMDVPLVSGNIFRTDRLTDIHSVAKTIRQAMEPGQVLAGVGYSMGAIVLSNYVATYGSECALSVAFAISGALECRYEMYFERTKRLWQPMIAGHSREHHLIKWGEYLKERLKKDEMMRLIRANNVIELDDVIAVAFYRPRYKDVEDYYAKMGVLGDIPLHDIETNKVDLRNNSYRIMNISIPLGILHALDDPISTWRCTTSSSGFLRPDRLVRSGHGNIVLLLTEKGGHVGWPTGMQPHLNGWQFMNEAASSFVDAFDRARRQ